MRKYKIFYNPYIAGFAIFLNLSILFESCSSLREVTNKNDENVKIYIIETNDGEIIDFRDTQLGYALMSNDEIISTEKNGEQKVYQVSQVKKIYTEKFNSVATLFLIGGIGLADLFIIFSRICVIFRWKRVWRVIELK